MVCWFVGSGFCWFVGSGFCWFVGSGFICSRMVKYGSRMFPTLVARSGKFKLLPHHPAILSEGNT
ncbi:hypothetical protein DPMN_169185 [Dreissena polymorpha]|uniref:Uncharacterized protein n=1 Tax=Dreissena polymorpha TaxID=45954 RepID=A0A9D4F6J8_DREPO|nr:hypothetical protein DPMN_169185 [Dreissena polymorpha]